MSEWGGRAMCPADDYTDPAIREEMCWHALEQALSDRFGDLSAVPSGAELVHELANCAHRMQPHVGGQRVLRWPFGEIVWRATTDSHLGEDASGLVDLTCTVTAA